MVTLANVKGYINGDERGVYEPAPSLLTYSELIALSDVNDILAELNTYPGDYYTALSNSGNLPDSPVSSRYGSGYPIGNGGYDGQGYRLYYDYVLKYGDSSMEGMDAGDMDINAIEYYSSTNTWATFYRAG